MSAGRHDGQFGLVNRILIMYGITRDQSVKHQPRSAGDRAAMVLPRFSWSRPSESAQIMNGEAQVHLIAGQLRPSAASTSAATIAAWVLPVSTLLGRGVARSRQPALARAHAVRL